MTHLNRTDLDAAGPPPPDWGPGKNAALSLLAFVVVFGMFAYLKGDARNDPSVKPPPLPATAGGTAGAPNAYAFVTPAESKAERTMMAEQAAPIAVPMAPVNVEVEPQSLSAPPVAPTAPPAPAATTHIATIAPAVLPSAGSATAAVPHVASRFVSRHVRPLHVIPQVVVSNTAHALPGRHDFKRDFNHQTYADALRELTARGPTHGKTPAPLASRLHPYGPYTRYTAYQPANVTHEDLSGAQALATARACAVMDQWQCVEENASRSLAIDPDNTESQTLLQQAIRNRI
jgi:hypothetical protein